MKDKRIKCCPNQNCEHGVKRKKHKYSAEDSYCKSCGSELVYACARCYGPLVDKGPSHRMCMTCEAEVKDRKDRMADKGKKAAGAAGGAAAAIGLFVKNGGPKKAANFALKILKK